MAKDTFIANPLGTAWEGIPVERVREGWTQSRFRDDITYVLARSVSKTGGFTLVSAACLTVLSSALTNEQAVDLYIRVRDESQRLECEWRAEFIAMFSQCADSLPPSNDAAVLREELEYVVTSGDDHHLDELLKLASELPEVDLSNFVNQATLNGFQRIAAKIRGGIRPS